MRAFINYIFELLIKQNENSGAYATNQATVTTVCRTQCTSQCTHIANSCK